MLIKIRKSFFFVCGQTYVIEKYPNVHSCVWSCNSTRDCQISDSRATRIESFYRSLPTMVNVEGVGAGGNIFRYFANLVPWMFYTFSKLCKWYQISQSYCYRSENFVAMLKLLETLAWTYFRTVMIEALFEPTLPWIVYLIWVWDSVGFTSFRYGTSI